MLKWEYPACIRPLAFACILLFFIVPPHVPEAVGQGAGVFPPANPSLVYQVADLDFPLPAEPKPLTAPEVEQELREFLGRNAILLQLLKVSPKDEEKLLRQIIDLDKQFKFINLKSLKRFEGRLNQKAWASLLPAVQAVSRKKFDLSSMEGFEKAEKEYQTLLELARKGGDPGKIGKYVFFLGLIQEQVGRQAKEKTRMKKEMVEARAHFMEAYQALKTSPDPSLAVAANDALEKVYSLDQDFGGILPLLAPSGRNPVLTSDLGMRKHPKKKRMIFHRGIDLANQGCDGWIVQTIGPGRVVKSGWESGYGYVVVVAHEVNGDTLFTRHAHLRKKGRIAEGTVIPRGTPVGLCNNTGSSTGTHLHFEVLRESEFGKPLDPKRFLPDIPRN